MSFKLRNIADASNHGVDCNRCTTESQKNQKHNHTKMKEKFLSLKKEQLCASHLNRIAPRKNIGMLQAFPDILDQVYDHFTSLQLQLL